MLNILLYTLIILCSIFLICLVLIQRGRGGGLAGAFGAAGGSSAFGTRAGDVFTRITIVAASIWIALNMLLVILSNRSQADNSAFSATQKRQSDGEVNLPAPGEGTSSEPAKGGSDLLPSALDNLPSPNPSSPAGSPPPIDGSTPKN